MARRDDDDDDLERSQDKPRRKPTRGDGIQSGKPRRSPGPDEEEDDDRPRRRRANRDDDDDYDDEQPRRRRGGAIIPYRNGMALAGYYCAFGGLIAILGSLALAAALAPNINAALILTLMYGGGGIFGLLAIVFGSLGCIKASRNPDARGTAHAIIGIVLGGLELIALVLIALGVLAIRR